MVAQTLIMKKKAVAKKKAKLKAKLKKQKELKVKKERLIKAKKVQALKLKKEKIAKAKLKKSKTKKKTTTTKKSIKQVSVESLLTKKDIQHIQKHSIANIAVKVKGTIYALAQSRQVPKNSEIVRTMDGQVTGTKAIAGG